MEAEYGNDKLQHETVREEEGCEERRTSQGSK